MKEKPEIEIIAPQAVIKTYSIPFSHPEVLNLIDAYQVVLREALDYFWCNSVRIRETKRGVRVSVSPTREQRRKVRNKLLEGWNFSKHYVDSAIRTAISILNSWAKRFNRRKAQFIKPKVKRRFVVVKATLFHVHGSIIKISIKPWKFAVIDLSRYTFLKPHLDAMERGKERIAELILKEKRLLIQFKREPHYRNGDRVAVVDVNLTNLTWLVDGEFMVDDLRELYHKHRVYETKKQRIQKLGKHKPITSGRLMQKYSHRERNVIRDRLHKLSSSRLNCDVLVMENLNGIKGRVLNGSKMMNRKLSKWNARELQRMLVYKANWLGVRVVLVNPAYTSTLCPKCGSKLSPKEGRTLSCKNCGLEMDRDRVACLNLLKKLQMWGAKGFPRKPSMKNEGLVAAPIPTEREGVEAKVHE